MTLVFPLTLSWTSVLCDTYSVKNNGLLYIIDILAQHLPVKSYHHDP